MRKDLDIIATIEKNLIDSRFKIIEKLPPQIRLQLKRIEDKVFQLWNLDNVYQGQIRLDCLKACANSSLTLDQLEEIINNSGVNLSKKYSFDKALRRIVKNANKLNGRSSFRIIKRIVGG